MGTRRKLDIIVDAEYKGGSEISQAKNDISDLDNAAGNSSMNFGAMAGQLAMVTGAVVAVGAAAKVAYDAINEGAVLEAAAGKFDNLSASINTTGDVLLGKMRDATKGMITDAELVASGTTIMSLGLAKTEGGVIRMASAVGALNLDMSILSMTLANDSVLRLDGLGLSMENVAKTKKELINSGFIGDAFDEAVLIELEKKMTLLGDASLTTAGKLQIVESQWKNVTDEMKKNAAVGAGPVVGYLSDVVTNAKILDEALAKGVITQGDFATANSLLGSGLKVEDEIMQDVIQGLRELDTGMTDAEATAVAYYKGMAVAESTLTGFTSEQLYANAAMDAAAESTKEGIRITAQNAHALELDTAAREASTSAMEKQRAAIKEVRAAEEAHAATMGDYFTASMNNTDAIVEYNRTFIKTGGLTQEQEANLSDLTAAQERAIDNINSLQGGTAGLGLTQEELNKQLEEQHTQLALVNSAMEPLAAITSTITETSVGFTVNQTAMNDALYAAADAAGADAYELGKLAIASGESMESVIEGLRNAAIQAETVKLGEAIAKGMDPAVAQNQLTAFIERINENDFSVQLGIEIDEEASTKTSDKQQDMVKGFEDISGASVSTGEYITAMVSTGQSDLLALAGSFDENTGAVDRSYTSVSKLKDLIIDGLPSEKIIKIKIVTEGSVPNVGGASSSGGGAKSSTGVPSYVSDALGS